MNIHIDGLKNFLRGRFDVLEPSDSPRNVNIPPAQSFQLWASFVRSELYVRASVKGTRAYTYYVPLTRGASERGAIGLNY